MSAEEERGGDLVNCEEERFPRMFLVLSSYLTAHEGREGERWRVGYLARSSEPSMKE